MRKTVIISILACLMAVCMPLGTRAQVDTVSLNQLDEYLSKASGDVKIYLKDWAVYDHMWVHIEDSTYIVEDYTRPLFPRLFDHSDSTVSIFDKYPDLRIELELEEIMAEKINYSYIEGRSLVSIKFPDNMKYIGVSYREDDTKHENPYKKCLIYNCPNLREIILPKKLKAWGGACNCPLLENKE